MHLIRHSLDFAAWKDRKTVAQALKTVYRATDAKAGQVAMDAFADGPWKAKYPAIAQSCDAMVCQLTPLLKTANSLGWAVSDSRPVHCGC